MKTEKGTVFSSCDYNKADPVTQQAIRALVDAVAKRYAVLDVIGTEGCKATVEQAQRSVSPTKATP